MTLTQTEQEKARVVADMIGYNHMNGKNLDTVVAQIIQDTIEKCNEEIDKLMKRNLMYVKEGFCMFCAEDDYCTHAIQNDVLKDLKVTLLATLKQD